MLCFGNKTVHWKASVWYDFTKGWSVIKYSNLKSDGTPGSNSAHADTDFPFFRLADAYLMYAEAVLRGGQGGTKEQGLLYLKELRERAGISPVSSVELTLDFILEERSRELYWEGHRRIDLIRLASLRGIRNGPGRTVCSVVWRILTANIIFIRFLRRN